MVSYSPIFYENLIAVGILQLHHAGPLKEFIYYFLIYICQFTAEIMFDLFVQFSGVWLGEQKSIGTF